MRPVHTFAAGPSTNSIYSEGSMAIVATVGARIGDYILVRKLGEGGMAEVWLARQHAFAQFRALKFLNAQFQGIPEVEARFQNEGENQLVHPNIVRIYEVGQQDGSSFLAMEFIDGRDLEKIMDSRRGPLTVPEAVDMGMQILAGLGFAHASGIVHRDIKPSNVLVDVNGRAYLMDFGIAKALRTGRSMTQINSRLGTPDYMSPEQIRNPRDVDSRSDIYSFGCLFYELLTGWPPFDRNLGYETEHDVKAAHVGEPPMPPMQRKNGLPIELDGIVLHCLAKAKEDRPQSCEEIIDALNSYRLSITRPQQPLRTATVVEPPKPSTASGTTGSGTTERRETIVTPPNFPPLHPAAPPPFTSAEPPPLPTSLSQSSKPASTTGSGVREQSSTPTIIDTPAFTPLLANLKGPEPPVTIGPTMPPPLPVDTSKRDTQKGRQKVLIGLGILCLLAALGGGGWILFHKPAPTSSPDSTDTGQRKDGDSSVISGQTPGPEKKPAPNPSSGGNIFPHKPITGGKTDPGSKTPEIFLPHPVPSSPSTGVFYWTGNITSPTQHLVTIYLTNQSSSLGSISGLIPPTGKGSISITSGNAEMLVAPASKTNYSVFTIYVPGTGKQSVSMKWSMPAS